VNTDIIVAPNFIIFESVTSQILSILLFNSLSAACQWILAFGSYPVISLQFQISMIFSPDLAANSFFIKIANESEFQATLIFNLLPFNKGICIFHLLLFRNQ